MSTESPTESLLVPKLQATSARGLPVPYPVHKTLIVGEGLDSAISFGRFSADGLDEMRGMVKVAVDLPVPSTESSPDPHAESAPINIAVGTKALDSFRESIQNSTIYERAWFQSGLPTLSRWLVQDLQASENIKPPLKTLISSVADDVEALADRDAANEARDWGAIEMTPTLGVVSARLVSRNLKTSSWDCKVINTDSAEVIHPLRKVDSLLTWEKETR